MTAPARPSALRAGTRELALPAYFPSVSSVKTPMQPIHYIRLLSSLGGLNRQFLVSAFDVAAGEAPGEIRRVLEAARTAGALILMDSGNYESFWKDKTDRWTLNMFHDILRSFPCDLAMGFDEQRYPADQREHVRLIAARWEEDQRAVSSCRIIPIVHAPAAELPDICAAAAEATSVNMVAVAERRLGGGIVERARTTEAVRRALDRSGRYVALHLLGTGNPISIALYSAMGADSFDGLEWCQTVVDHETALLYHQSHADFFRYQTAWGDVQLSFQARSLAHNLEFYADWMRRLRAAVMSGAAVEFCRRNFPARIFAKCAGAFGWE